MYRKAVSVSIGSFLLVSLNMLFQSYLAYKFGAAWEMDAYLVSTTIPLFVNMVLAGSLTFPFLSRFAQLRQAKGDEEALNAAFKLLAVCSALLLGVAAFTVLLARHVILLTSPGLPGRTADLAAILLGIQAPATVFWALATLLTSLHNGRDSFLLPAAVQVGSLGSVCLLAYALIPYWGILAVAVSMLLGSIIHVLCLVWPLIGRWHLQVCVNPSHPFVKGVLMSAVPLVAGALFIKMDTVVDRFIASSLPEGTISHLSYAWRVIITLAGVVSTGLIAVSFPKMCRHAGANEPKLFYDTFITVARFLVFLIVPASLVLLLLGDNMVRLLFERGRFTAADAQSVTLIMGCYIGLFVGHVLLQHVSNAYYALNDTRTPTLWLAVSFAAGVGLKFVLVVPFTAGGLAAATSIYYMLATTVVGYLLFRKFGWHVPADCAWYLKGISLSALGLLGGSVLTERLLKAYVSVAPAGIVLVTVSIAGLATYFAIGYALRLQEGRAVVDYAIRAVRTALARGDKRVALP